MERKNAKERSKRENAEANRILSLVDLAYRLDPRVKKHREEERLAKEAIKQKRREEAQRRKDEEEERERLKLEKEQEILRKQQEAEEAEKEERARQTKAKRKRRQRVRQLGKANNVSEDIIEFICTRLDLADLDTFCDALQNANNDPKAVEALFTAKETELKTETPKEDKSRSTDDELAVWSAKETALLTKVRSLFLV